MHRFCWLCEFWSNWSNACSTDCIVFVGWVVFGPIGRTLVRCYTARVSDWRRRVSEAFYDPDVAPVGDPLFELAHFAAVLKQSLHRLGLEVNELGELRYSSAMGLEQVRGEVELFERFSRIFLATLAQLSKMDLASRVESMQNRYGDLVIEMFNMVLNNLQLDDKQYKKLDELMPRIIDYIEPKIEARNGFRLVDGEIILVDQDEQSGQREPTRINVTTLPLPQSSTDTEVEPSVEYDPVKEALIDGVTSELKREVKSKEGDEMSIPYVDQGRREAKAHEDVKQKARKRFEMIKNQTEANRKRAKETTDRRVEQGRRIANVD